MTQQFWEIRKQAMFWYGSFMGGEGMGANCPSVDEKPKWCLVEGSLPAPPNAPLKQLLMSDHWISQSLQAWFSPKCLQKSSHGGRCLSSGLVLLWGQLFCPAKPQHVDQQWLTENEGIAFTIYHNQSVTRPLSTISDGSTNLFPPSLPPSIPHLLCHNEELPLKLRLQDKPAQLGLRSQLHLLKQSLEHYGGQIWRKEFGNKDCLCRNTLDETDEFQLMNLNTCIMHNEQGPKGKRDREETSCHH